ncbi:MAG: hypothetical protein WC788_01780 [Candidatus Paceibacterota bacterium]|jgi:hypothetical protein
MIKIGKEKDEELLKSFERLFLMYGKAAEEGKYYIFQKQDILTEEIDLGSRETATSLEEGLHELGKVIYLFATGRCEDNDRSIKLDGYPKIDSIMWPILELLLSRRESPNLKAAEKILNELTQKRITEETSVKTTEFGYEELKRQYENQKEIFRKTGVIRILSNGESGIKGIDGKEYSFPEFEEIADMIKENGDFFKFKWDQGFNKLLIVPFGMKFNDLVEIFGRLILRHDANEILFGAKQNHDEQNRKLYIDSEKPILIWSTEREADMNGNVSYRQRGGSNKTKKELLASGSAFNVLLVEDLACLPAKGGGQTIGGRKQLECGMSPKRYLGSLLADAYQGEDGISAEDQITLAIIHLENTNELIDAHIGGMHTPYILGIVGKNSPDSVYSLGFHENSRLVYMHVSHLMSNTDEKYGVRTAVRII